MYTNLGIGVATLPFLSRSEQLTGQLLNKFTYGIAISRAQTKFYIAVPFLFGASHPDRNIFCSFDTHSQRLKVVPLRGCRPCDFVQVNRDLYVYFMQEQRLSVIRGLVDGCPVEIPKARPVFAKRRCSMVNFDNQLICFSGGFVMEQRSKRVYCYLIGSNSWVQSPDLNSGRSDHISVVQGNAIYIIGGTQGVIFRQEVAIEKFADASNLAIGATTGRWETLTIRVAGTRGKILALPVNDDQILICSDPVVTLLNTEFNRKQRYFTASMQEIRSYEGNHHRVLTNGHFMVFGCQIVGPDTTQHSLYEISYSIQNATVEAKELKVCFELKRNLY